MKSGNLNFLEPSGPLQAYNGTALPFMYCLCVNVYCITATGCQPMQLTNISYEGWNFNSGNYLFTTDTK